MSGFLGWFGPVYQFLKTLANERRTRIQRTTLAANFRSRAKAYLSRYDLNIWGLGEITRPEFVETDSLLREGKRVLLLGDGGTGKTGILVKLVAQLLDAHWPTIVLRGDGDDQPFFEIRGLTPEHALNLLSGFRGSPLTLVIDQYDNAIGTPRGQWLMDFAEMGAGNGNIRVLVASRLTHEGPDAAFERLGFQTVQSRPLGTDDARGRLHELGIPQTDDLMELATNLLNLSLLASLKAVGLRLETIRGITALWNAYRSSIEAREEEGCYELALELANQAGRSSDSDFPRPPSKKKELSRLVTRGVLTKAGGDRYAFRHESLRDYLFAWSASMRDKLLPSAVIPMVPERRSRSVLRWMVQLYHEEMPTQEPAFVQDLLSSGAPFYTRAAVLDALKEQPDPSVGVARALRTMPTIGSLAEYFFRVLTNPAWLLPLLQAGTFSIPPGRQPAKEEGWFTTPRWPAGEYLVAMARAEPEKVAEIVQSVSTDNPMVYVQLADACMKLPGPVAARLVPRMSAWIEVHNRDMVAHAVAELVEHFAGLGEFSAAVQLLRALTRPAPVPEALPIGRFFESQPDIDGWVFEDLVTNKLTGLAAQRPLDVVVVLQSQLETALQLQRGVERSKVSIASSEWWRPSVEPSDRNSRSRTMKDRLLEAILNTLSPLVVRGNAGNVLESYTRHPEAIFRRLALYLLSLAPDRYTSLVSRVLTDRATVDDSETLREFCMLLGAAYAALPETLQAQLLTWILGGPTSQELDNARLRHLANYGQTATEADVRIVREYWTLRRLRALGNHALPDDARAELTRLEAANREPDLGEEALRVPPGRDPLAGLTPLEAVERAASLEIEDLAPGAATEDVPRYLTQRVAASPNDYAPLFSRLLDATIAPRLVESALWGVEEARRADREINWSSVVGFFQELIDRFPPKEQAPSNGFISTTMAAAFRQVADLLQTAFRRDFVKLDDTTEARARAVALCLLELPEPAPECEAPSLAKQPGTDIATLALNTGRPAALRSVIWYAHAVAKRAGPDVKPTGRHLDPENAPVLERHLDIAFEPRFTMRSVFGEHFPVLHYCDPEWALGHLEAFFPLRNESILYWAIAFGAYVALNGFYSGLFPPLREHYRRGLGLLGEDSVWPGLGLGVNEQLVEHLMFAYWLGAELLDTPNSLIRSFFSTARKDLRSRAIWSLGRGLKEVRPPRDGAVWRRLLDLWRWRVEVASDPAADPAQTELASFTEWLEALPEDLGQVASLLEASVRNLDMPMQANYVASYLSKQAEAFPVEAVRVLRRLLDCTDTVPFGFAKEFQASVRTVLQAAADSDSETAQADARAAINRLGWLGDYSYRDLLEKL